MQRREVCLMSNETLKNKSFYFKKYETINYQLGKDIWAPYWWDEELWDIKGNGLHQGLPKDATLNEIKEGLILNHLSKAGNNLK